MGDIDDDHVGPGSNDFAGALEIVARRADGGGDAEAAALVSRRERMLAMLDQIPGGNQAQHRAVGVDEGKLLDLARRHHPLGVRERNLAGVDDQPIDGRHPFGNRDVAGHETHVALRQQSRQSLRLVDDDERPHAGALHHGDGIADALLCVDRVRIADDAVLGPLDRRDLR